MVFAGQIHYRRVCQSFFIPQYSVSSNVIEKEQNAHNHFTVSDSTEHCCAINSGSRGALDK